MAVDHGDMRAMNNLGYYYQFTEINYYLMKKCYLVAIENNVCQSMENLKIYYHSIKNYKSMIMCNLMQTQIDKDPNNITLLGLDKYYCEFDISMKRLELYLNHSIIISRYNIIGKFNKLAIRELTPKQKINFKQLVDAYEFNHEDELCEELQLLIKN